MLQEILISATQQYNKSSSALSNLNKYGEKVEKQYLYFFCSSFLFAFFYYQNDKEFSSNLFSYINKNCKDM